MVTTTQEPVGDDLVSVRHGDRERVRRLVQRMVVHGEPGGRDLGLAGDGGSIRSRHEAGPDPETGQDELDGDAAIADFHLEAVPLLQRALRGNDELLAAPTPACPLAVDLNPAHVEPNQVEVEAAETLGGGCAYRRIPVELICGRVVGDVQVVVADVVAAVPVRRVVRVSEPRRAGNAILRLGDAAEAEDERRERDCCETELAAERHPRPMLQPWRRKSSLPLDGSALRCAQGIEGRAGEGRELPDPVLVLGREVAPARLVGKLQEPVIAAVVTADRCGQPAP